MRNMPAMLSISFFLFLPLFAFNAQADRADRHHYENNKNANQIQLGPRPFYLVNDMDESPLKHKLENCQSGPFKKSDFSIGHRGAALQFPEHTKESYVAAAKMGAGILECDVTFTKDKELVCRHSQCDLHTTTNILATPLAAKCSIAFQPATFDTEGNLLTPATAQCCTSDLTLEEFKTLKGKMDAGNKFARNVQEFLNATPDFRTDLYASTGTLMTHAESIELFKSLGTKMTPELKSPSVTMPFDSFSQEDYAQKMIEEYKAAGVAANKVWAQSFNLGDILYWINNEPTFGEQAVYLDDIDSVSEGYPSVAELSDLKAQGVNIIAPPMWALVSLDTYNKIIPSEYAINAKSAGLDIITWTLERSGTLVDGGGWYYQSITPKINNSGDTLTMLDVLAKDVGVLGVFSDWPATTTYYANCMGLK